MKTNIKETMRQHAIWIDSLGKQGRQLNLDEAVFTGENWCNINLADSYIIECQFDNMILKNVDLYFSKMYSSVFKSSNIQDSTFVKAELDYSTFYNCYLRNVDFSKSSLMDSVFCNVRITDAQFINVGLENASFQDSYLENMDFSGAYLENTYFGSDICMQDIQGLEDAHIGSINLGTRDRFEQLLGENALQYLKDTVK